MIDHPICGNTAITPDMQRASLRPLAKGDADAVIRELQDPDLARWLAAFPVPVERNTVEKYLRFLRDPDVFVRVVCCDGAPVGVISLGTELSFWIAPSLHRRGLGRWAVRNFLDQVPGGIDPVNACCMCENATAAAFLRRLGFECTAPPFRRFSFAHGHGVDFLRFQWRRARPDQHAADQPKGTAKPALE